MKFVNGSHENIIIPDPLEFDVYKHLERIGKTCYKSEDKITDDSCVKYLNMIRDRKHWAMLEHYVFVMRVSSDIYKDIRSACHKFNDDYMLKEKIKFIDYSYTDDISDAGRRKYYVSGSITSFNYIWECPSMIINTKSLNKHGLVKICMLLHRYFPEISKIPEDCKEKYDDTGFLNMSKIRLLTREEIKSLPYEQRMIHDSLSIRFITNLGVSHDLVRSRPVSYAMESTRWINYSKKCGYTYTVPLWFNKDEKEFLLTSEEDVFENLISGQYVPMCLSDEAVKWIQHLKEVENTYKYFSKEVGYQNDKTSLLLPKNYKTELVLTTRIYEWKHLFFLRCQNDVRPDMRRIIVPLVKELIESGDPIWDDQKKLYDGVNKDYE